MTKREIEISIHETLDYITFSLWSQLKFIIRKEEEKSK